MTDRTTDQATAATTDTPITATATAQTIRDEITKLKTAAKETLRHEFEAIAEAARTESVDLGSSSTTRPLIWSGRLHGWRVTWLTSYKRSPPAPSHTRS